MTTPCRSPFVITLSAISPRLAYMRMLRASSEIAAAITVWSPLEKPAFAATLRPCWRAVTTSTSDAIGTSSSSGTVPVPRAAVEGPLAALDALPSHVIEEGQPFLQIERGRDALERQAELHHRKGDLGLDPDDDGLGAAQPRHVRDVAQGAHGERVHDVERRHVHDDAARTEAPYSFDQRFPKLREIGVGERRLYGRDQVLALLENRNFHSALRYGSGCEFTPSGPALPTAGPCSRAAAPLPRCRLVGRLPSPSRSGRRRS